MAIAGHDCLAHAIGDVLAIPTGQSILKIVEVRDESESMRGEPDPANRCLALLRWSLWMLGASDAFIFDDIWLPCPQLTHDLIVASFTRPLVSASILPKLDIQPIRIAPLPFAAALSCSSTRKDNNLAACVGASIRAQTEASSHIPGARPLAFPVRFHGAIRRSASQSTSLEFLGILSLIIRRCTNAQATLRKRLHCPSPC